MTRLRALHLLFVCSIIAALLTGCTRDPNVRKQKYFDSGQKYFAEGKYREAVIQYSNAVQIDDRFTQAHAQLAQAYLKLGDGRVWRELYRTIELDPANYRAHTDLANLLVTIKNADGSANQDRLKEAKTHLDLLRQNVPNSAETHEAWSNYYSAQGDYASAINEAQQCIAVDPSRSESYLVLAMAQEKANRLDDAEASFKKAIAADPKSTNAQLFLGVFYQTHHHLAKAEQQFRRAIAMEPANAGARAALEFVLMQQGKKDETEAFLKQTKADLPDNAATYSMLAEFYVSTGNLDKALDEYSSLYHDHPKDLPLKKAYIRTLLMKNRMEDAAKLDNEILKSHPNDVDALIFKGEIQISKKDSSGAVESLQAALKNDADNPIAHYQLGLAYTQQHNIDRAESEWRQAVRLRPGLVEAQLLLGDLEFSRGETDAVLATAQQIITARPDVAEGYILKAAVELELQHLSDAQHDAQEAIKRSPNHPSPYAQLGTVELAQKHFSEAEKYYQQSLEKNPAFTNALNGLMRTYVAEKQPDKAIAAANAQIAKVPNNSNLYDLLGTALYEIQKDNAAAHTALQKAVDLDKHNVDAIEKLGRLEIKQGATDQALALCLQAIKDNPQEVRFYNFAGEIYENKQNWDQAKAMYQQALNVSPDNPFASNNLAYMMLQQGGNVDVALNMAQTARRAMPNSPNFADTLGWAYYQKGIYQSAVNEFQEALRLTEKTGAPDDATVHYHLGLAYQKMNQNALARQQLEKAVKLKPDNTDARKALSDLRS